MSHGVKIVDLSSPMTSQTSPIDASAEISELLMLLGEAEPAPSQRSKLIGPDDQLDSLDAVQSRLAASEKDPLAFADTTRDPEQQRKLIERAKLTIEREHALQFLRYSISEQAYEVFAARQDLLDRFLPGQVIRGYVVSLDLRGSTAMMLKAVSAKCFAAIITETMRKAELIVKKHFGVFDKFTGDGALVFFPEFFAGDDAGLRALYCANEVAQSFADYFRTKRSSFVSVPASAGFGAGIDYGEMTLLRVCGALTIVGQPVVYACRLSCAPAGRIFVNQPAHDALVAYHGLLNTNEVIVPVKHEDDVIAYDMQIKTGSPMVESLAAPDWLR